MMAPRFDVYDVLDCIRHRPGMYLGTASITRLHAFLNGCLFGAETCGAETTVVPEFGGLHDWVARRLGWKESTAGWSNMILAECGGDEAAAIRRFFELLDEYRQAVNRNGHPA